MNVVGFDPIETRGALVVVLGTLPGGASLRMRQYYADPSNSFWHVMGALVGATPSLPYAKRVTLLNEHRIAVWDVLRSADRVGSSDSAIVKGTEVANDIDAFVRTHQSLKMIYFNGRPSHRYFRELVLPSLTRPIPVRVLPSTSPANTHLDRRTKSDQWRAIGEHIGIRPR